MKTPLTIGQKYTRPELRAIFNIPGKRGKFANGHCEHKGQYFIFATIDSPATTGHNYDNKLIGNELTWESRIDRHLNHPSIQKIINAGENRHIFTRINEPESSFTYQGHGTVKKLFDQNPSQMPAKVIWDISTYQDSLPEEIDLDIILLNEGAKKQITVNAYERNPDARKRCVEHYGYKCTICEFDFAKVYGILGKNFIHAHHIIPLSNIREDYAVNPIQDLRPVCPNCHAMLHRKKNVMSIEELRTVIYER